VNPADAKETEGKLYGESSQSIAKTQKIIGNILILTNQYFEAQRYLNKALKVFKDLGLKKAEAEIKDKLRLIEELKEKEKQQAKENKMKEQAEF